MPDGIESENLLDGFRVRPDDIVTYYKRGAEFVDAYRQLYSLLDEGQTRASINKIVGKGRARIWLDDGTVPPVVKALTRLHEIGFFGSAEGAVGENSLDRVRKDEVTPFDHENERFLPLNLLDSMRFSRGSLYSAGNVNGSRRLRLESECMDDLLIRLVDYVAGGDIKVNEKIVAVDSYVSRILEAAGSPLGSRTITDVVLPRQVVTASNILEDPSSSDELKDLSRHVVRDWLLMFFYVEKCRCTSSRKYHSVLTGSRDPDIASKRFDLFKKLVEYSELPFGIGYNQPVATPYTHPASGEKYNLYSTIVHFDEMSEFLLGRMRDELRGRILGMIDG